MKKLKLMITLLLLCSLLGCSKNTTKPYLDEPKEAETSIDNDEITETVSSYPVNQNNLEDIIGLWTSSNGWSLLIIASEDSDFPNIALCSLYKDSTYHDMSIDESERINENTLQLHQLNGSPINAQITFTKEGILLSDISDINFKETLFTRPGLYSNSIKNLGDDCYSGTSDFYVHYQYVGNQITYLILMDVATRENWIAYYEGAFTESYENTYLVSDSVDYYPQNYLKGFPHCVLYNAYSLTETEYYNYLAGTNQSYENGYSNNTPTYTTPECDFPLEYSQSFYFAEEDVWVIGYLDDDDAPFEISNIELLEMDDNTLKLKVKVRNDGSKPYFISVMTLYCDKYGFYDEELNGADLMTSIYIPSDQPFPEEISDLDNLSEYGMRLAIPSGRDGYLFFVDDDNEVLTYKSDISDVTKETRYIYLKLYNYTHLDY